VQSIAQRRYWMCVKARNGRVVVERAWLTEEQLQDRLDTGWVVTPIVP
jgi:hypothetical protein